VLSRHPSSLAGCLKSVEADQSLFIAQNHWLDQQFPLSPSPVAEKFYLAGPWGGLSVNSREDFGCCWRAILAKLDNFYEYLFWISIKDVIYL
jgi:hypothetical protein